MPTQLIDLRLYTPQETDDYFTDKNGVDWTIYGGTPVAQLQKMIDVQQRWPDATEIERSGQIPVELFFAAIDALWANLRRANHGRTKEDLIDGMDAENDVLTLVNLLSLRLRERAAQAQQTMTRAPQPTAQAPSRTSTRTRKRTISAAPSPVAS